MNVELNEDLQNYVQEQATVEVLEKAIIDGEQSGFTPWDINEVIQGAKHKIDA